MACTFLKFSGPLWSLYNIKHSSSSPPPPRHRSTLRSEEIRLSSQSRARSLSTPKRLPIENLLKNFEDDEEEKVVKMEKTEIPIGRPVIVYDNSSGIFIY